jgi:hypothetical protein
VGSEDGGKTWKPLKDCKMSTTLQALAHNDECWFIRLQVLSPKLIYALAADNTDSLALFRSEDEGLSSKFDVLPFKGNREHDFFFADPKSGVRDWSARDDLPLSDCCMGVHGTNILAAPLMPVQR